MFQFGCHPRLPFSKIYMFSYFGGKVKSIFKPKIMFPCCCSTSSLTQEHSNSREAFCLRLLPSLSSLTGHSSIYKAIACQPVMHLDDGAASCLCLCSVPLLFTLLYLLGLMHNCGFQDMYHEKVE